MTDTFARAEHAWLQPPDEGGIGPCRHCPGMCPIDDHWHDIEADTAGCERHPECEGYEEYTADDHAADEADRAYSEYKESGPWD